MRVSEKRRIAASRETVWAWVCDPARYPDFMDGVSRWAVIGDRASGCGARWDVRLQIGAAPVGGVVEVVEFEEPGDLAWISVTGVTMRGRWRLRERTPGETEVVLRLAYQAPGGLMGVIADRVAAPIVRRSLRRSLRNLQMLVESRPAPSKVEGSRRWSGASNSSESSSNSSDSSSAQKRQPAKKAAQKAAQKSAQTTTGKVPQKPGKATKSAAVAKKATKAAKATPRKRAAKAG